MCERFCSLKIVLILFSLIFSYANVMRTRKKTWIVLCSHINIFRSVQCFFLCLFICMCKNAHFKDNDEQKKKWRREEEKKILGWNAIRFVSILTVHHTVPTIVYVAFKWKKSSKNGLFRVSTDYYYRFLCDYIWKVYPFVIQMRDGVFKWKRDSTNKCTMERMKAV